MKLVFPINAYITVISVYGLDVFLQLIVLFSTISLQLIVFSAGSMSQEI